MTWQKVTGYGRRSLAETGIGQYKAAIGPRLRARTLPGQQGEVALAVEVLNRMTRTANRSRPVRLMRSTCRPSVISPASRDLNPIEQAFAGASQSTLTLPGWATSRRLERGTAR